MAHRLVEAIARLDALQRERLDWLEVTPGTAARDAGAPDAAVPGSGAPSVVCRPHPYCGEPFGGLLAPVPDLAVQVEELTGSGILGTVTVDRHDAAYRLRLWSTPKERRAWEARVQLSLHYPQAADLLRAAGELKVANWRREQVLDRLHEAVWAADLLEGIAATDLIDTAQVARATYYRFTKDRPDDWQPPTPTTSTKATQHEPTAEPESTSVDTTPAADSPAADSPAVEVPAAGAPHATVDAPTPTTETPTTGTTTAGASPTAHTDTKPTARPGEARTPARVIPPVSPDQDRFTGPAAVVANGVVWLPDGTQTPFTAEHLGDVAALAAVHRLGWGGGEDRLPDLGQVWLSDTALTTLGLPRTLDRPTDAVDRDTWRAASRKAFDQVRTLPAFTQAEAAGWEFRQVGVWTKVSHPEHLRQGAWLMFLPWHALDGVALLAADPTDPTDQLLAPGVTTAPRLVGRLREFARATGVAYRITPAATGLDLIDHTRPPLRDEHDQKGQGRGRAALVYGRAAELPPFLTDVRDMRWSNLEADFSWWRAWESLGEEERSRRHVVAFDRGRSYLAPWSSIDLGLDQLQHTTTGAHWDGKEKPGYWLVEDWTQIEGAWPWWLPDLGKSAGVRTPDGRIWVTSHTLKQLAMVDVHPEVFESWTWGRTARYLERASTDLKRALDSSDPAVVATTKALYASTVGKLGQRDHQPNHHLWRPDWRHHIIAATRTGILSTLLDAQRRTGAIPLVVDRDTIMFATDADDPSAAWPGKPEKLGTGVGAWKPAGIALLADWGPEHLPGRNMSWRYRYNDAMAAMQPWPGHTTQTLEHPEILEEPGAGDTTGQDGEVL